METPASTSPELPPAYSLGCLHDPLASLQAHCPFTTRAALGLSPTTELILLPEGSPPVFSISHYQRISPTGTCGDAPRALRPEAAGLDLVGGCPRSPWGQAQRGPCRAVLHIPDLQWPVASSPSLFGQTSSFPHPHDVRANPQICTPQRLTQGHPRRTPPPLLPAGWITTLTKACFLSFSSHSFNF